MFFPPVHHQLKQFLLNVDVDNDNVVVDDDDL